MAAIPMKKKNSSGAAASRRWNPWAYVLIAPPIVLMAALIFFPTVNALISTLFVTRADTGRASFTVQNYVDFFSNRILTRNFVFTIEITLVSVVLLFLVGFPIALYLRFSRSKIATGVQMLALFPLFVPGIILAFALIRFVGSHGMFESLLSLLGIQGYSTPYLHPSGIVIGLVWENIPFTVLVLTAGLRQVEDSVIESARDVGASLWQVFTRIILPLTTRSFMIVFSLNVIGIFGSFTLPYLMGPAQPMMMGVSMQQYFNNYQDRIGALTQAVVTFVFCAAVGFLYVRTVTRPRVGETS